MFGIEIIDASLLPALFVALFAGLISFLSPCVLPIVPPYLAYMSGVALNDVKNKKGRPKIVFTALFFVLGLSTVFIFLGFSEKRNFRLRLWAPGPPRNDPSRKMLPAVPRKRPESNSVSRFGGFVFHRGERLL